jgi:hypothetical protein
MTSENNLASPYPDQIARLKQERDAQDRRIAELEGEVERLRSAMRKDPNTIMIAYEDGRHQKLARWSCKLVDTLIEIAEQDVIEIALDPEWPRRVALAQIGNRITENAPRRAAQHDEEREARRRL